VSLIVCIFATLLRYRYAPPDAAFAKCSLASPDAAYAKCSLASPDAAYAKCSLITMN